MPFSLLQSRPGAKLDVVDIGDGGSQCRQGNRHTHSWSSFAIPFLVDLSITKIRANDGHFDQRHCYRLLYTLSVAMLVLMLVKAYSRV